MFQIDLQDGVSDGLEHEPHVLRVCKTDGYCIALATWRPLLTCGGGVVGVDHPPVPLLGLGRVEPLLYELKSWSCFSPETLCKYIIYVCLYILILSILCPC